MNKRVIAAVGAAVLAALGVIILIVWAQGANQRAYEGAELVSVVRVTETVPSGTKAADLAASTEIAELPADAIPDGAVTDLAEVQGLSTLAELQPGEVLVEARMGAAGASEEKGASDVPPGLQEVSIFLDNQRTVAASIKPGDRVGVLGSYEAVGATPTKITDLLLHDVLVTRVNGAVGEEAVTGLTITLAVSTVDAERIVFTQEWGRIWLTLQNADTAKTGERIIQDLGVLE